MKKLSLIICIFILTASLNLTFAGCSLFGDSKANELIKQGYTYDEANDWYVKDGEEVDGNIVEGRFVNFTLSKSDLSYQYIIGSNENRVTFIGNSAVTYTNFNIIVSGRYSNVHIELKNFKFEAGNGVSGIDASDVSPDFTVYVIASGTSSVKGGAADDASNGTSYTYNKGYDNPVNGGNGKAGITGYAAIRGNNVYVSTASSAMLTITGGNGGNGGDGGDGCGGSSPGIGQSGHGGNGGVGGDGGTAIEISQELKIENNGMISICGGQGGNGGNGGRGGDNMNTLPTDRADHGGNGGNGGQGGKGGIGLKATAIESFNVTGNIIRLYGGQGGQGGNGNNGGASCKNTFQTSKGGTPGAAGNGGNGGNGGVAADISDNALLNCINGQGGQGGVAGSPGYSSTLGYGSSGVDGRNGITYQTNK